MQQSTEVRNSSKGMEGAALPIELVSYILEISAHSHSTQHARNVCLVSRSIYTRCWPSLHRIIALRTAKQLKEFSDSIYQPEQSQDLNRRLERRQDAIQFLYLNNNRDTIAATKELSNDERPEMWMLSITLAARNLQLLHVEEFWSISYPWESQEEKPLLAYPLLLLTTHLATLHASLVTSSESRWGRRMSSLKKVDLGESSRGHDSAWEVPQPREVTLSALAMLASHLISSSNTSSINAFARLTHLHLYYAKMDELLVSTLIQVPQLTHLRLTRPFSENLSDAVFQLLGGDKGQSKIECVVVEAGIYMDDRTMARLNELQDGALSQGRFRFIDNNMLQRNSHMPPTPGPIAELDETSSTSHIVNWVTSSEQRGFEQFLRRAQGGEGVWAE